MTAGPVLIVEDEPSIRELLSEALQQEGFEAVAARDGEEALRLANERRPALVILDMGLPVMDGATVAARIRGAHDELIPFIVVTASRRIEDAARTVRAARYITKPFDITDVVAAVRSALEPAPGVVPANGTAAQRAF
jgi:DNA-binding response OmpR family regulator